MKVRGKCIEEQILCKIGKFGIMISLAYVISEVDYAREVALKTDRHML